MAIEIRAPGGVQTAAQTGTLIGQAEKRKRSEAEAFQLAAEERAKAWELEKMQMNSQQQFAHELRLNQVQLDAEARAHEWEVEKMQIRSQLDFQEEEKERQRVKGLAQSRLDSIDKAVEKGEFSKDDPRIDTQRMYWQSVKDLGSMNVPTALVTPKREYSDVAQQRAFFENIYGRQAAGLQSLPDLREKYIQDFGTEPPFDLTGQMPQEEKVQVIAPDGTVGTILKSEVGTEEYKDYKPVQESSLPQEPIVNSMFSQPNKKEFKRSPIRFTPVGALLEAYRMKKYSQEIGK